MLPAASRARVNFCSGVRIESNDRVDCLAAELIVLVTLFPKDFVD